MRLLRAILPTAAVALGGIAVAVLLAIALPEPSTTPARDKCVEVYGACVLFEAGAPAMSEGQLKRAFELAAQYWGAAPSGLVGYIVYVRGVDPFLDSTVWGVTFPEFKRLDFAVPRVDCPEFIFVHEYGHGGADIHGHDDPRFDDPAILKFLKEAGVCRL